MTILVLIKIWLLLNLGAMAIMLLYVQPTKNRH